MALAPDRDAAIAFLYCRSSKSLFLIVADLADAGFTRKYAMSITATLARFAAGTETRSLPPQAPARALASVLRARPFRQTLKSVSQAFP